MRRPTAMFAFASGFVSAGLTRTPRLAATAALTVAFLTTAVAIGQAPPATAPAGGATTQPAPPTTAPKTIDASDAEALKAAIKTRASVTGAVSRAALSSTGKVFRIEFKGTQASRFNAVIFPANYDSFKKALGDDLAAAFAGKTVTLTGTIEEYRGNPQIVLSDPAQVRFGP